jgi:succinyl-CoA synthetase beta subunit
MNIHEHQGKQLLKKFGAPVSRGIVVFSLDEIDEKIKELDSKEYVLKAQIHAGGRGKGGGVKLVKNIKDLKHGAKKMFGMNLITHQTGPEGKKVQRLYIEEASDISKEFYLSCLVDRESSKIAFISSTEGGMDIEKVAADTPQKIITIKVDMKESVKTEDVDKIIKIFNLNEEQKSVASKLFSAHVHCKY